MKTLIVRKVDETGRIVIPMEMRKDLAIKTNQYLRIEKDGDKIILEKYSYDLIKDKIKNIVLEIVAKSFLNYKILLCIENDIYYSNYDETYEIIQKLENLELVEDIEQIKISKHGKDINFCAIRVYNNYDTPIGYFLIKNYFNQDEQLLKLISLLLRKWNNI